jgi:two-component system, NarL family, nitrate/nitrite response regulator NarL
MGALPPCSMVIRSERRMFRDALSGCIGAQPDYLVVGHVGRLDDLLSLCRLRQPQIALVDVGDRCSDLGSLRDCAALTKVVVVYDRLSQADLEDLCRTGVHTLVPGSHGLAALRLVLGQYLAEYREDLPETLHQDGLTALEEQVITLVSAGHTVEEMAHLLELGAASVANIKRRIYRKLEVVSQGQAVARAIALGMVARPPPLEPEGHPTGSLLCLLHGTPRPAWHQVCTALLAGGVPFATRTSCPPRPGSGPEQANPNRGAVALLVDPEPEDWPTGRDAGLPVVLVRTTSPPRAEVIGALLRGSCVVMTLEHVATDLVPALTLAARGHVTIEAAIARTVLDGVRLPATPPGLPELSARELDILRLIAAGNTVRRTARALGIAEKTVENTQSRLYRKLGARNRAGALAAAHALGLLESRPPDIG